MLREHRFHKIEDALHKQPFLEIKDLASLLRVSDATVRRDLETLHQAGRIERTRGGAMSRTPANPTQEAPANRSQQRNVADSSTTDSLDHIPTFKQRMQQRSEAKERIGAAAASLIDDGQNVLVAGGTTPYAAATHLRFRRISVVTNSLPTALLLGETMGVDVLVTGGMVYPKHDILIGPQLKETLTNIRAADWLLLGAGGADDEGFFDSNHWEVEAQRELMSRANRVALLLDAAKFERRDMVFVADWSQVHVLVTDAPPSKSLGAALRRAGVKLIIAADKKQEG